MFQGLSFRDGLAALVFAGLLAYAARAEYFGLELLAEIAIFAVLAMSLDLLAGVTGLVSLGHAAFFGLGAYGFAALTVVLGWPPGLALMIAPLATGLLALVIGAIVTRVRGIFFIMITLAFGEMGHEFIFKSRTLGGDDGLAGIPRLDLSALGVDLVEPRSFAVAVILVAVLVYVALAWLLATPYGKALAGIHSNEQRMRALGLPVRAYKTSAFALAGAIAGLAGVLAAQHTQFITPQLLHWTTSGEILVMVILGGLATLVGPVVGAILLTLLRHELSNYTDYWGLWLGLFLILVVVSGRNGLVGVAAQLWQRWRPRREGAQRHA